MDYKQFAKKNLRRILYHLRSRPHHQDAIRMLKCNDYPNRVCSGEEVWHEKWAVLGHKVDPVYYRVYYHYLGQNPTIVPTDISRDVIEPLLNHPRYKAYLADKNVFDRLFPAGILPRTILRKMDAIYYDASYRRIQLDDTVLWSLLDEAVTERIIIKPAIGGMGGLGVQLFTKQQKGWYDVGNNVRLDYDYLTRRCADNLIVQECLAQDDYIGQFNSTSVNTLRLAVYRSVKDDRCHVVGAIMRIGSKGSVVDNAHAGGRFVGIEPDGTLCNTTMDQWGTSKHSFNDIDFSRHYRIPEFDKIVDFAKKVGACVPQQRLLALDIMIDKEHTPRLIEFNVQAYSMWLFQFTTGAAFGVYTDEIIAYCKERLDRITYSIAV